MIQVIKIQFLLSIVRSKVRRLPDPHKAAIFKVIADKVWTLKAKILTLKCDI